MKNMLNESNPLKSGPGKGSSPRNLSKKFRENYDQINWGKPKENPFESKCVHYYEKDGIHYGVWTTPPINWKKGKKK